MHSSNLAQSFIEFIDILNKFSTGQSTKENKLKMHEEDDVINKAKIFDWVESSR